MAVCTFFGHRYAHLTDEERSQLTSIIVKLIKDKDVDQFWLGAKGEFDSACRTLLSEIKEDFPNIKICLVLSYIPTNKEDYEWKEKYYDHIFLPDGVEEGPQRFAISRRNWWMALNCDYMICYVRHEYGGAYSAMKVALANKKEVINIAPQHN